MSKSLSVDSPATYKPNHSTKAKEPSSARGSFASCSLARALTSSSLPGSSLAKSRSLPAASAMPPGASTPLRKLKRATSASPCTANWHDIPPPDIIPAKSPLCRPGVKARECCKASHSALASSCPLSTMNCARGPRQSSTRSRKCCRLLLLRLPSCTASRTPAVAPRRTTPSGSSCSSKRSRFSRRSSSCNADASASPLQEDFSQETCDLPSSWKKSARVEPLPQSTKEIFSERRRRGGMGGRRPKSLLDRSGRTDSGGKFSKFCTSSFRCALLAPSWAFLGSSIFTACPTDRKLAIDRHVVPDMPPRF
mmetsp:Transcript_129688/g.307632  ORF Transcript_129688/g.307632 Transcript_129688/m.307632 type:complete len:309 (+) Transcript_129688:366-1292(+)